MVACLQLLSCRTLSFVCPSKANANSLSGRVEIAAAIHNFGPELRPETSYYRHDKTCNQLALYLYVARLLLLASDNSISAFGGRALWTLAKYSKSQLWKSFTGRRSSAEGLQANQYA